MGKSKAIRHEDETVCIMSGAGAGYCEILVDSSDETADLWLEPDADAEPIEEVLTFAQLAALITAIRAIPEDVLKKLGVR